MSELRPANPNLLERLMSTFGASNQQLENMAFGQLAIGGDEYAAADPRAKSVIKEAGVPQRKGAAGLIDELISLYSGGPSGTFWTTNPARAASYGEVRTVQVPKSVFESGRAEAARLGQPTKFDTVLPSEWANKAVAAPQIKPTVYEAEALSGNALEDLLASLGVKKF